MVNGLIVVHLVDGYGGVDNIWLNRFLVNDWLNSFMDVVMYVLLEESIMLVIFSYTSRILVVLTPPTVGEADWLAVVPSTRL